MRVGAMQPTTHTPPDPRGSARSPRTGHAATARHIGIRIEQIRARLDQIDALVPTLSEGHLGRLEELLGPMHERLGRTRDTLAKWDGRRERCRGGDTVEIRGGRN